MGTATKYTKIKWSAFKLLPLLLLSACGTMSGIMGSSDPSERGTVRPLPAALQTAICEGRGQDALDALTAEPLFSASDRFYTALALEETGAAMRARSLYAAVMQTGSTDIVRASCADRVLADGLATDEAARRLAALSQQLAALDVNLAPERPLHNGLARTSALNTGSIASTLSYSGGASQSIVRPASQSPLGQWFAHLTSYGSIESATSNRATLEKKFPALTGLIDQWELVVNGNTAIRLGVRVSEKSDADRLCNTVKSQGEYCAVIDTSR
ncbi:hypothetical protein [Kordiimonas aquimaris]|uniref:hypothetical protein n=1 Tax=Kordiimonas aquimaris TaxID=707591 RepID=UPI0021D0D87C|nr:hypothetical protein [Kordiimonas aquimaris]